LSLKRKTLSLKARAQTPWEEAAEDGRGAAAADGEDEE